MRVLILSADTGGGHRSTAEALAEQFAKMNIDCEIADALSMISEKVSGFISWGHSYVYRKLPRLFGTAYRFEERHPPRQIYDYFAKGSVLLQEKLLSERFDAVISVHVFAGMMMTEARRRFENPIPHFFVATDYTCSPGVSSLEAEGFFIPHRMLFCEFVRGMLPADKLYATGIPLRSAFRRPMERREARRRLGLREEGSVVLLCCGSMGCGKLDRHALELANRLTYDTTLVILCGNNQALAEDLGRFSSKTFRVEGFTRDVPLYMSAADLTLTKPGGLMTTEAIAMRLPMVLIDAVPGCETRNYDFLVQQGVAEGGKNWKQAISKVEKLLANPALLEQQREQMEKFSPVVASEQICRCVAERIGSMSSDSGDVRASVE